MTVVPIDTPPPQRTTPTGKLARQLGQLLMAARERNHLSRYAFAGNIPARKRGSTPGEAMHPNSVRDIELGRGNPTLAKVEEWADLYGVEIELVLRARGRTTSRTYTARDVRAWCKATGLPVSPRGRLSEETLAAYEAAHRAQRKETA